MEMLVCFAVACVQTAIADHFEMFLRYVPDQAFDEIHDRDCFLYKFIIFMSVVMKMINLYREQSLSWISSNA